MITRTFKLCLNAGTGSAPYINVSQYDEGETWLFELYSETGERYIPTTGAIVGVKSDGHGIANTGTVDSEGRVVIAETQQMTASAGRAIYELSIDGLTHGTANFIVAVERKPTDDAVMSDSDLSLIQEAIDSAEVIVEVIGDGDPSEVIGEHVDEWLDNHPEATTTVLDGAITAPKINNSLWDKLLVSEEASGAIASFDDGADDVPVSSLKVALEPVQLGSGDPSPSNVRPIIAANGKNLLNVTATSLVNNGITYAISDGIVVASGTATGFSQITVGSVPITVGNQYTLSPSPSGATSTTYYTRYVFRDANGIVVPIDEQLFTDVYTNEVTRTAPTNAVNLFCYITVLSGTTINNAFKPMIRLASITDSTFQPYQGIMVERTGENVSPVSYPYTLGQSVYGGTVDLATGVLTVTDANIASYNGETLPSTWISDRDVYASGTTPTTGAQVVYKLATPQTVQLTPTQVKTLLGYNNISSSGIVDVIYHADTKLYVDKMTAVDNNIIAPTEATFTATRNYTVNDLVIVNDTLYKVTSNIQNGGTITPNSNVQQTTLSALIKALS